MEAALAKLQKELDNLEKSQAYKKEQAFKRAIDTVLKKHNRTKADLIAMLAEDSPAAPKGRRKVSSAVPERTRKQRKLKIYKNPNTGEKVETRGGNHKVLKQWKAEYKLASVEEWLVKEVD